MTFIPAEAEFEQMVRDKIKANDFTNFVGFSADLIQPGLVEGRIVLEQHHLQQMGFVHGGVSATLADIVMGYAAFTLVKKGNGVVTVDLKTSYLHPAKGDTLYAKGYVIKAGQKLSFCEAEIWVQPANGEKLLTAKSTSVMAVVTPEDMRR